MKIHGEAGEGLSFATGLIYQLAVLQAVVRNIERYNTRERVAVFK